MSAALTAAAYGKSRLWTRQDRADGQNICDFVGAQKVEALGHCLHEARDVVPCQNRRPERPAGGQTVCRPRPPHEPLL